MGKLKVLASDTIVYGVSTILSRLVNWLMMPLYTYVVSQSTFGTFSYIYSFIAVLLVVVTLGFETGYFRFVNSDNSTRLLGSLSNTVLSFGLFLMGLCILFKDFTLRVFGFDYGQNSFTYLLIMLSIVVLDSYNSIFFAELRYHRRSILYAILRLVQVLINVSLTLFFFFFLKPRYLAFDDITFMMIANLVASLFITIWFLPRTLSVIRIFDISLIKQALIYSLPLVGMGFFGQANVNIEKILFVHLDTSVDPYAQLGIYAAAYKIGVLMSLFTQSFRMAFEPFFFKETRDKTSTLIYAEALRYFYIFGLIIYAGVSLFLPLIFMIINKSYNEGQIVVPYILLGQLFFGVYYSLSLWYKVTDRTYWGIIMSVIGLSINTLANIILIPRLGYFGAAVSTLIGYTVMMFISYLLGQKYYPIAYPISELFFLTIVTIVIVHTSLYLNHSLLSNYWLIGSIIGFLLTLSVLFVSQRKSLIPLISKFLHKK